MLEVQFVLFLLKRILDRMKYHLCGFMFKAFGKLTINAAEDLSKTFIQIYNNNFNSLLKELNS